MSQFRYSRPKFRQSLFVAAALTVLISGFAWMMLSAAGSRHVAFWTSITALVFFGFVSAGMLIRFLRDEVVLAVLPTGLLDTRFRPEPVAWDDIRDIALRQSETEFELEVHLWKAPANRGTAPSQPDFTIELASLDAEPGEIVAEVGKYRKIRNETGCPAPLSIDGTDECDEQLFRRSGTPGP